MMSDLLCKDCKHSFQNWYERAVFADLRYTLRCRLSYKTEVIEKNYVVGHKMKKPEYELCSSARYSYLSKEKDVNCGEQGRFWEPKHKKGLFKLIAKPYHG
jgi:hypothetical protein